MILLDQLSPEAPFFAVGDIHGCKSILKNLMRRIDEVADGSENIVFLGDYIDRGLESQQVLIWLFELTQAFPDRVICLMGNHERMMLDFIDDPAGRGGYWLRHGGMDTLASFGVEWFSCKLDAIKSIEIANNLEAAMPEGMQDWLRSLPLKWVSGNMHCVHAAMSPLRPVEEQRDEVLLWGHPDFLTTQRNDENFVLHGHTIVKHATITGCRIPVDTGAYKTGRLSAVRVSDGECSFIESE
ncbi:serine/threonine protein phosphatase [Sulfitobacter pseudonitzschiae]|uniref:Serine/threonine protein phosphatase n=1 Tax=Pseudosulfitobacter pseudonitzschiae TaxID=1402135 RepID=A0A9Q2RX50_9RHOB|nr:serine/threonine protein phosphatase [Pseudosulfitobacter pseudonitzschiae]MBM2299526.1 serine/threonine protein phosphatase [Pseudosulfitobacter pseudonitzschiae]MBM2304426.1 serine/threonine protein phosphatase [Pseudosulfitobacter pseudonitzschiae]MBM2314172.1 serine/threonine protein phosphatase [Pseudosulfitobacter pseudonitzschiae]MBM2319087.1 serine/threonine protein phosphatase [Pseudosulfitobacter pseudonitzschiae]